MLTPAGHLSDGPFVLALNGGSSSIRFALYAGLDLSAAVIRGKVDRIERGTAILEWRDAFQHEHREQLRGLAGNEFAVDHLVSWVRAQAWFKSIAAIGHRVVHGMRQPGPHLIDDEFLATLDQLAALDPLHAHRARALVAAFRQLCPQVPHVACFDTSFHRNMPQVAKLLPIPRRYQAAGVERYGFHGLSYAFCMAELDRIGDPAALHGRVVLAHLGGGSSLAAVLDGVSVDTSMGFTPTGGIPMGSRSGDLDPSIAGYLARNEGMTPDQFDWMVNHNSGLLGISETSSDVRDLLSREQEDVRAAEALQFFCYQARKGIGSLAAALGGIDTLVFTGGIGENSAVMRERICDDLAFLGIQLDVLKNVDNLPLISADGSRVRVRIILTDEEQAIAQAAALNLNTRCHPTH